MVARKKKKSKSEGAFPEFFRRRLLEIIGIALFVTGIYCALALLSYDVRDPSADLVSENSQIYNWGGKVGAYIAHPVLQFIGLGSFLLFLIPCVWGFSLFRKDVPEKFWLRIIISTISVAATAGAFALLDYGLDIPHNWPYDSYGGFIGDKLNESISPIISVWAYGIAITAIALSSMLYALGMTTEQWSDIGDKDV